MNDQLIKYLTDGGLIKTLGIIILFLFTLGGGAIVGYDILTGQAINPIIATFMSIVLTHVTNMMFQSQTSSIVSSALLFNPAATAGVGGGDNASR